MLHSVQPEVNFEIPTTEGNVKIISEAYRHTGGVVQDLVWGDYREWAKPLWVFAGPYYYASGGLQNLRGRYDTLEQAIAGLIELNAKARGDDEWDWYQIVDVRTCELVRHKSGGGHMSQWHHPNPGPEAQHGDIVYYWPNSCGPVVPQDTEETNLLNQKVKP